MFRFLLFLKMPFYYNLITIVRITRYTIVFAGRNCKHTFGFSLKRLMTYIFRRAASILFIIIMHLIESFCLEQKGPIWSSSSYYWSGARWLLGEVFFAITRQTRVFIYNILPDAISFVFFYEPNYQAALAYGACQFIKHLFKFLGCNAKRHNRLPFHIKHFWIENFILCH